MKITILAFSHYLCDIKRISFAVLLLLVSSLGFAQTVTTNKTVTANTSSCGIVNVKVDITGSDPITRNSDIILVIDVSGSMGNTISGDTKTSMDYAKLAAKSFITQASANTNNRISIVSYTTNAKLEIGLTYLNAVGVTALNAKINALTATNNTNIQDGIVKAEKELETNGRFDCATGRSIILLTDGVANRTGSVGSTSTCNNVSTSSTCVTSAITAATNAKTTVKSSITYNNQIFSVGLFGGIPGNINTVGSDKYVAKYTLDGIQGSPSYITQNGANLTAIYNQIATQISWIAQSLIEKETIIPGFTIGSISVSKGTTSVSGQVITWNTDFLNSETITLNYQLTPTGSACGNQTVSTSTFSYQNTSCSSDSKTITSPSYFVPCLPLITGMLTACGSTTLTASTNAASPTYVWYKDDVIITEQTAPTLVVTASGAYKVTVKNGSTNCELTSAASTITITPAAALVAPNNVTIEGCSTASITGLVYKTTDTAITLAQLNTAGGSLANSASLGTYTISYSDTASGTCPIVVNRTFKVTTGCGIITKNQIITIQDTTAPNWTTTANALNVTLQCSDSAGLASAQNQASVATDNCGGTIIYTKTSGTFVAGSCANSGTYTNTWITKDVCLNSSTTFTQIITIQDTTAPTWTTTATALNVTLQCNDSAGLTSTQKQAPVATDNCGGAIIYTKTSGTLIAGSCANSGTYTNTWIAKDVCLNTSTTFTQVITIEDTTAPIWTTNATALNVTLQCNDTSGLASAQKQAPVATDNCGGTITYTKISGTFVAGSCANSGTYTNTWIAKDVCLNASTIFTQVITIIDNTAPTWTTTATALNVTLQCNDSAGLASAQNQAPVATDNCGGTIIYTKTSGTFVVGSCINSGTYTNTWIAKDICLNSSSVFTQIITIQDTTVPTWTTTSSDLNVTLQCSDSTGLTSAQNQTPVATDNCGGTITYTKTSGTFVAGSCANAGTYINTWIAKDVCLNTSSAFTQVITIEDTAAPTWTTTETALNVTLQCSDSSGLTSAQNQTPVATDNCGGTIIYTKTSGSFIEGSCSNSGTYTNTWIAKDVCLNTSTTFTQIITIEDTTAPTWTTTANALHVTLQCSDSAGLTTAQNQAPVATDNCGGTIIYTKTSGTFVAGSCANSGTYTNTWIAKDVCLNSSTVFTQVITIEDNSAPTWTTASSDLNITLQCSDSSGLTSAQNQAPVATDNCGGAITYTKTSGTFIAGSCANSGTYTNTWIAKDVCLNTSTTFTQVITIGDTAAPTWTTTATALNVTLQCSDSAGLTTAQNQVPVATDNCGGTITYTKTSGTFVAGSCANSGTYTNTWIAKDVCLNTSSVFTQVITIEDTIAPTWTTASSDLNVTLQCNDTSGLTSAQNQTPVANDNCGGTIIYTKTSGTFIAGSCANSGTYINTWIAKDVCLNSSTAFTQIITIQDTATPTWTTTSLDLNVTLQCSDSAALTSAQNQAPVAADNCGGTVTYTKTSGTFTAGSCVNSGTYTNTWIAKDVCLNTSTVFTQIITIQDTTAPTWSNQTASLNKTIECNNQEALASAQDLFPIATDSCDSDVSNLVKVSGSFVTSEGCSNAGTYTNTWTVKDDCGNTSQTFTQIITIQDTTAPTWLTETTSLNKTIECSNQEALASAQALFPTATDSCDSDVSNLVKISGSFVASEGCSNAGTYTNTWTVKDDCGNTSQTFTQVITIQDTTAPTWSTQTASLNKTIECNNQESLASAQALFPTATDSCDSDVSNIVKISGSFVASEGCSNAGTYTNTWTVKDDCGNTSETFTQIITIQDTTAPTWSTENASLNKTIECSNQQALASAQALFPIAADSCDSDVSNLVKISGSFVASEGCSNAGTYTNTWTVKDDCGNSSETFTQIITIQDTTVPTFIGELPQNSTVSCDAVPQPANLQASDNCNGALPIVYSQTKSAIQNECDTNYTLIRKWTISDCSGNTVSHTQIITVRDTTPPTGTAPANIVGLVSIADIPIASTDDVKDVADNCSNNVSITISESNNGGSGCEGNPYIVTRTYTLTDCAGNSTNLVQTITIENQVPPISIINSEACNDDATLVNLLNLLPANTTTTGIWVDTNGTNALQGNIFNPFGLALGNYTFEYKINHANCPRSILLTMEINDDCIVLACGNVLIHNAFSPNGDGMNDIFKIDNIDELTCYPGNTVEIYNRWGILVFDTIDYNNTTNAFDGTSRGRTTIKQSEGLPTGTYFYIVNYQSLDVNNAIQMNKKEGYLYLSK
ncbi:gliding motility-associated-like protein [Flavobacterium chryseum]|uniref:HYR-like domain-containing protein n=1 Tax=Flavobacterium sp. P3160 TaxID=2512113 RepID=UPI00105CD6B8|nr:gliding motility-associated C-terminal domain-containing protein [Flavobacterium sp. P3160]TDO73480.1 gliding motility-associated-like protein [Flavobacterium sp. P3160]